jgi:hypothetical protein
VKEEEARALPATERGAAPVAIDSFSKTRLPLMNSAVDQCFRSTQEDLYSFFPHSDRIEHLHEDPLTFSPSP